MKKVRKAVIPVAGFGTRFLPATKSTPKEMMPLIDKPIIHYIVEEAVNSGIETIIFVTGRHKRAIEDYFDYYPELEQVLNKSGKEKEIEMLRQISNMAEFVFIRQKQQLGLGHAVLTAANLVGNEPFAVLLGDEIIKNDEKPGIKQLIDIYYQFGKSVIGTMEVPKEDVSKYGIVAGKEVINGIKIIESLIEKPSVEEAPSTTAIIGRYVLTPNVFDALRETPIGRGGEIQLTDGLSKLREKEVIYAKDIEGIRHDTGNKLGYIEAIIDFALDRQDLKDEVFKMIKEKYKEMEKDSVEQN
ncbi:MAG TPA: UTP--glucose-1-phosphate uridylyltransferase [Sulfurihydrogenibium sp.]|uniref:UTP--glucose-1-phosphate uridylyltransferase GalU n=1 Tax=Sulfurihydrogenibium sp. (strain YO3AOP1) TaxID=436114 RepID=UPI00017263FA|nr:UTP--glucose-1-phosphate uridylyltransferase GalU [Sulfurihydrogenibium sp. YO3AOP1]ACD66485.1 UTP-glucose-1-phosphate uridylyltransferase [Sulfurihydrogenibium sp. YO3AOP1]HBT98539.1 UTP--glucose-1-phosphate uridylyltransferase [Sulfurihydrogenibium sp.]